MASGAALGVAVVSVLCAGVALLSWGGGGVVVVCCCVVVESCAIAIPATLSISPRAIAQHARVLFMIPPCIPVPCKKTALSLEGVTNWRVAPDVQLSLPLAATPPFQSPYGLATFAANLASHLGAAPTRVAAE